MNLKGSAIRTVASVPLLAALAVQGHGGDVHLSLTRKATAPSGYGQSIETLPMSVSVVTREDIRMSNARQTTGILGALPGVFVRKTGDAGRADIDIRGIGGNGRQLGVLIDGRPDKMGLFGCAVTHTLPMNNVERIEVIRGPESVLYGSDAFGGAVNIITRRATKRLEGSYMVSGGTFNTQNYLFQQGSRLGRFDYYLSVNKRSTDGHTENSRFNASDFSGRFGYGFSSGADISVSGKYFTGIKNEPFPAAEGTWNDYGRGAVDVTYRRSAGGFDGSLKVYRSFGEHVFSDGFHSKDHTDGAMFHGRMEPVEHNRLSLGADYRSQFGDVLSIAPARLRGRYHKYEYGVYVNDAHTFFDRLTVSGGLRYNRDEFAGEVVTPRFGAVYDMLNGTTLRGVWSRGFRAPQLNDLYLWGGNRDLKPERVTSAELGFRRDFGRGVVLDVAGFVMKGTDLIQFREGRNVNIGEFEFRGVETALAARLSDSLSGQVNYTYLDPGTQTTGRPGDKAGASVRYARGDVRAILTGEYVGRYYAGDDSTDRIDDYLLFNTKVDYRLTDGLSLYAAVDNITDREYRIYYNGLYTMPGRTLTCGVSYVFG